MATTAQNARFPAAWRSMRRRVAERQMPTVCHTPSAISHDHTTMKKMKIASGTNGTALSMNWLASRIAKMAARLLRMPTTQ